jgi:hypothetical protein
LLWIYDYDQRCTNFIEEGGIRHGPEQVISGAKEFMGRGEGPFDRSSRWGARRLLAQAIQTQLAAFLASHAGAGDG